MLETTSNYEHMGLLGNEEDVFYSFVNDFSGSTYICDAITEIADNFIPCYNGELWENAPKISDYIEDAIQEGLCELSKDVELTSIFASGHYKYFSELLYNNERELYYNYAVPLMNYKLGELEEEKLAEIDMEELSEQLDEKLADIDNNNTFEDIRDAVVELFEELFEEEETEE